LHLSIASFLNFRVLTRASLSNYTNMTLAVIVIMAQVAIVAHLARKSRKIPEDLSKDESMRQY
jgi:hypothetical protein